MEYIAQFYECFECLVYFVCVFIGLKCVNEIVEFHEYITTKHACNKIGEMMADVFDDIKKENKSGKHSKED